MIEKDEAASEAESNALLCSIKHLAILLEVEDHELLECIERMIISEQKTKQLWLALNT